MPEPYPHTLFFYNACLASSLPAREKLTLFGLSHFANRHGGDIRPGAELLAALTGQHKATVHRSIASLRERGILVEERASTLTEPAQYLINVSKIPVPAQQTSRTEGYQYRLFHERHDWGEREIEGETADPYGHVYRRQ